MLLRKKAKTFSLVPPCQLESGSLYHGHRSSPRVGWLFPREPSKANNFNPATPDEPAACSIGCGPGSVLCCARRAWHRRPARPPAAGKCRWWRSVAPPPGDVDGGPRTRPWDEREDQIGFCTALLCILSSRRRPYEVGRESGCAASTALSRLLSQGCPLAGFCHPCQVGWRSPRNPPLCAAGWMPNQAGKAAETLEMKHPPAGLYRESLTYDCNDAHRHRRKVGQPVTGGVSEDSCGGRLWEVQASTSYSHVWDHDARNIHASGAGSPL